MISILVGVLLLVGVLCILALILEWHKLANMCANVLMSAFCFVVVCVAVELIIGGLS